MPILARETPVLERETLFSACRAIYELAGGDYVLPPMIRDARQVEKQSGRNYKFNLGGRELCFSVALDEAYADRNALPNARLPIRFGIEIRDANTAVGGADLIGPERNELVRAFLLGMKAPISAEKIADSSTFRLSIKLAATYSVDCGAICGASQDSLSSDICDCVAHEVYQRSSDFFDDADEGLAVWRVHAAQDLFGEARPAPEVFWPLETPPIENAKIIGAEVSKVVKRPQHSRCALAASVLFGLLGAACLASNFTDYQFAPAPDAGRMAVIPSVQADEQSRETFRAASLLSPVPLSLDGALRSEATVPVFASFRPFENLAAPAPQVEEIGVLDPVVDAPILAAPAAARGSPKAILPAVEAKPRALVKLKSVGAEKSADARLPSSQSMPRKALVAGLAPLTGPITGKPPKAQPSTSTLLTRRAVGAVTEVLNGIKRIPYKIASLMEARPLSLERARRPNAPDT